MPLPIIIGAVSAAGSLLGDVLDQSAAKKAQQQAIQAMKALLIPAQETNKRADMYGDDMYTRTMGDLNTGAFAYAGALNPETMRTMAFSKMATARSQVETGVREEDYKRNQITQSQIAQIAAQPLPTIDVTGAIGAGVGGYLAGTQLEMSQELLDLNKKYINSMLPEDKIAGVNTATNKVTNTTPRYEAGKPSYFGKDFSKMISTVPVPPNPYNSSKTYEEDWDYLGKQSDYNYKVGGDSQGPLKPNYGWGFGDYTWNPKKEQWDYDTMKIRKGTYFGGPSKRRP